jgi:hypothetical protein
VGASHDDVIEDTGRRRRRWPLLAAVIVIAAVLAARFADGQVKSHESHLLAARAADAQATAEAARAAVLSTRQYTMPLLVSSSSATVRSGLEQLIDDEAAHETTQLEQARDTLDTTSILPWHHALLDLKQADLSLLDTQIAALEAASQGADLKVLNALMMTTSG